MTLEPLPTTHEPLAACACPDRRSASLKPCRQGCVILPGWVAFKAKRGLAGGDDVEAWGEVSGRDSGARPGSGKPLSVRTENRDGRDEAGRTAPWTHQRPGPGNSAADTPAAPGPPGARHPASWLPLLPAIGKDRPWRETACRGMCAGVRSCGVHVQAARSASCAGRRRGGSKYRQ